MSSPVPPQKASPFLRIPGELRDRTYELALSEADGLTYGQRKPTDHYKVLAGYNQQMFTCKQVFQETAGLELKCNKIVFIQLPPQDSAGEQFIRLLKRLAPPEHAWLRWCFPEPKGVYSNNYPESDIDFWDVVHFLNTAEQLAYGLKRTTVHSECKESDLGTWNDSAQANWDRAMSWGAKSHPHTTIEAANFRIRPAIGTTIDEAFMKAMREAGYTEGVEADILLLARDWIANGL